MFFISEENLYLSLVGRIWRYWGSWCSLSRFVTWLSKMDDFSAHVHLISHWESRGALSEHLNEEFKEVCTLQSQLTMNHNDKRWVRFNLRILDRGHVSYDLLLDFKCHPVKRRIKGWGAGSLVSSRCVGASAEEMINDHLLKQALTVWWL